ncbi:hypothetical protein [Hungatella hathewayi]|uniref:hypothetical protein n=1 Tax=Hungatella hathewayi TaxID=154046 RepID=UPI00356B2353
MNTIGLTADKVKKGVMIGGVAGTCDWIHKYSEAGQELKINDYLSSRGELSCIFTIQGMNTVYPYASINNSISFLYGGSEYGVNGAISIPNSSSFHGGYTTYVFEERTKIGFRIILCRVNNQVKITLSDPTKAITISRIYMKCDLVSSIRT